MSLPELVVEVAFRTDPDAAVPEWEDVSEHAMAVTVRRGRQHELDTVQAGTCTVRLDNGDRRFDPTYTHSPYYPNVLPMRKIRVSAVWEGTTYYLFTGYVERWPIEWEAPRWGSVTVTAVDGMALLAQADLAGTFPEELSGARVDRVLAAAFWPESTPAPGYWTLGTSQLDTSTVLSFGIPTSSVDEGQTLVAEETFEEGAGMSALAHIQEVVAAERGVFFIDGEGRAVFQDRFHRYGMSSLVTFTDDLSSLSSSRLKYQDLRPEFDVERVATEVIVTRDGGTPQVASGFGNVKVRRTLPLNLPLVDDAEALARAQYELAARKDARLEFTNLTVLPPAQDAAWPFALSLEISDKVTVERTPGSVAAIVEETIDREVFVEAVTHTGSPGVWSTAYQLSPADLTGQFLVLGTGTLDSAVLAY